MDKFLYILVRGRHLELWLKTQRQQNNDLEILNSLKKKKTEENIGNIYYR